MNWEFHKHAIAYLVVGLAILSLIAFYGLRQQEIVEQSLALNQQEVEESSDAPPNMNDSGIPDAPPALIPAVFPQDTVFYCEEEVSAGCTLLGGARISAYIPFGFEQYLVTLETATVNYLASVSYYSSPQSGSYVFSLSGHVNVGTDSIERIKKIDEQRYALYRKEDTETPYMEFITITQPGLYRGGVTAFLPVVYLEGKEVALYSGVDVVLRLPVTIAKNIEPQASLRNKMMEQSLQKYPIYNADGCGQPLSLSDVSYDLSPAGLWGEVMLRVHTDTSLTSYLTSSFFGYNPKDWGVITKTIDMKTFRANIGNGVKHTPPFVAERACRNSMGDTKMYEVYQWVFEGGNIATLTFEHPSSLSPQDRTALLDALVSGFPTTE